MIIEIDKDYRIITDEMQYIVQRSNIVKATKNTKPENIGKKKWVNIAYITSIDAAIRYITKNITLLNNDTKTILDKLDVVYAKIDELGLILERKLLQ